MNIESEFDISFSDAEASECETVGALHTLVCRKVREANLSRAAVPADELLSRVRDLEIWAKIQRVIARTLGIPKYRVTPGAHFIKDLGAGG